MSFQRWSLAPPVRYDRSATIALARAAAGESLDVYDDRVKLWVLLAISVAFATGGTYVYEHGEQAKGLLVTVFFSLACCAVALRLVSASPALRFDANGVTIRRLGPPLRLAWTDMRSAYVRAIRKRRVVCLAPHDVAFALAAASGPARALMRANIALVGAPYTFPTALTLGIDDLLAITSAYAPALEAEPAR